LNLGPGGRGPDRTSSSGLSGQVAADRLDHPDGLLAEARAGDRAARETLLSRYSPYVLKIASRVTGTYVKLGRDDEASVALVAFNEAIDSYDPSRGASFLGFAQTVIRRRLIDHFRGKARSRDVPLSALGDGDAVAGSEVGDGSPGRVGGFVAAHAAAAEGVQRDYEERSERLEEVQRYRELLAAYGITLAELVRISPRHEDARRRAMGAARVLAARPELAQRLRQRGELPLKELSSLAGVSRKTLERQRKYIIAVALILMEDLPCLEAYLK
jgi:RNA polymerase sigma factor